MQMQSRRNYDETRTHDIAYTTGQNPAYTPLIRH